jgi:2-C-methyl-D-erythritol 4-phosphate cytidylyltransferase / 2-C-methyl-D-erythritol 2,4-cyclodiphosphate synthase
MPKPTINAALIVAAGTGSRARGKVPKQFRIVNGAPVLRHCIKAFVSHSDISSVYVVIAGDHEAQAILAAGEYSDVVFVTGGATRRESVLAGLTAIDRAGGSNAVLIHDAARPFLSKQVIDRVLTALIVSPGAVPALPVVDSLSRGEKSLTETVARQNLWRVQTPQAFRFRDILTAHLAWDRTREATDDAQILQAYGGEVAIVEGDEALSKFTFSEDFEEYTPMVSDIRVGNGFDVHRLVPGDGIWLCGIFLPFHQKLMGHSDADVALHAITDAMLGALAMGDIGDHFPPSDPKWRGSSSDQFLFHACNLADQAGYQVGNIDVTIICEAPKIGPHRQEMRNRLAEIMTIDIDKISVKATTTEMLGFTGRGEGIAAQASAVLLAKA